MRTDQPDVHFQHRRRFIQSAHGCSEWTLTATAGDGSAIQIDGCDLFTFVGDKIQRKRTHLKHRS
ncbi:MAG: nuclear transport factor 2 family protein [Myxococcales bacterium]|nr:nuclear transport factor 2 family protein [Myxococcales bacterium]